LLNKLKVVLSDLSRGVSLIVAPRGTGTTVTFNIPGRVAIGLVIVAGVILGALAFSGYTYIRLTLLSVELSKLRRENGILRSQVKKMDEIRAEIAEIDRMRRQIESWAGVTPPEAGMEHAEERTYVYVPLWPRRYSYDIMRQAYLYRTGDIQGMISPASGWVSRWFSDEAEGVKGHPGVDIVAATGTPVRCALDGEVVFAGWDDIYGNVVRVQHNDSIATVYGHNDEILVKEGEWVARGEVIAKVGNTGRSTAPHLHFEVQKNGIAEDPGLYVNLGRGKLLGN